MSVSDFPVLTAIIATPLIGAMVVALVPEERREVVKIVGYLFTIATLALSLWLLWNFKTGNPDFQYTESYPWIPGIGVRYAVGVDGISIFMVVITALLMPIGLLASARYPGHRVKAYTAWLLVLEMAIMGIFLALDLVAFFIFWEFMLVPMYFLIQGWGHERRQYAATKFFLYTAAGSALLLASTVVLGFLHQADTGILTFDYRILAAWGFGNLSITTETILFVGFLSAFAIKVPLFPFHTWLPDVHTEAPTVGSVLLAGVIIKMGAYGILRFSFELFPRATVDLAPILLVLAVIGIIYGAVVAAMQKDLKRVIAYSSVAHMGFVVLGIASLTVLGIDGAVFTMVSHPLTTGALFLLIGMLYERRHTRLISDFGGLWTPAPVLTALFVVAMFAGIGLPGFSGFVGEFLALAGAFISARPYAVIAAVGVILAAVYLLWAFQRAFTGKPSGENATVRDLSVREIAVVVPLLALSLFLGLHPSPVLDRIEPTVKQRIAFLEAKTDFREERPSGADRTEVGGLTFEQVAKRAQEEAR
ncbi:MAG: NADH-quinone oxidoreductase subunit M [Acidimicrobiia bacterium]